MFSNSEAGDSIEIMMVCMGKRNLDKSCVLYEVTQQQDTIYILWVCMGKRNLDQRCVLYEVTLNNKTTLDYESLHGWRGIWLKAHVINANRRSRTSGDLSSSYTTMQLIDSPSDYEKTVNKSLHYEPQDFWLKNVALK